MDNVPRKFRPPVARRGMHRAAKVVALGATLLFLLSTIFAFGIATHHESVLSWTTSAAGAGIMQAYVARGQIRFCIDRGPRYQRDGYAADPRGWHAGVTLMPGLDPNVRITDRFMSKVGLDFARTRNNPVFQTDMIFVGISGIYPVALSWLLVWLVGRKKLAMGLCPTCGYDLRATPDRCPECGALPEAAKGAAA